METVDTKPERFFWPLAAMICAIHLVAVAGGAIFFSLDALFAWFFAHQFFATVGISLGHHRYLSHKNFQAPPLVDGVLGLVATLCFQGGPIYWATAHRAHHIRSERIGDPHSAERGFWWSHFVWLFYIRPNGFSFSASRKWVTDLDERPFLVFLERNQLLVNGAFLAILFGAFGLMNRWDLAFWIGPVRIVTVWHATWMINSYSHGANPFRRSRTGMRNSLFIDLVLGGEGWHAHHHSRPGLVTHPGRFHLDLGYYLLRALASINLIRIYQPSNRNAA